ncbi:MAG: hypothetical protein K2X47_00555 [Bdellovibrionales bacterium]|nr:hypothetical protein [Bdellovibrionales bacterium]
MKASTLTVLTFGFLFFGLTAHAQHEDLAQVPTQTKTEIAARTDNWSDRIFRKWETPVDFNFLAGTYDNTSTIRFNFKRIVCIDSIQITAEAATGAPVVFVVGMAANNPEPVDQDIHAGTITLPPAALPAPQRDPHYSFRINRMQRQVSLMVAGGSMRIMAARAIVVKSERCPAY